MVDLVPNARQQFLDADGAPLVGGLVYMYVPGTTIPKTTYFDQSGIVPNSNPIVLDDLGSATIWGDGLYRQYVTDALGNLIWDDETAPPGDLTTTNGSAAGIVAWFSASTPPAGWLLCDGTAYSRTTYNLLFAAIGTNWGAGDGSTTFNVPNFLGYFLRSWDYGGRAFGSTQSDAVNSNTTVTSTGTISSGTAVGTVSLPGNPGGGQGGATGGQNIAQSGGPYNSNSSTLTVTGTVTSTGTVSNGSTETRPINVALLCCISTGQGIGGVAANGVEVLSVEIVTHSNSPYIPKGASATGGDAIILTDSTSGPIVIYAPSSYVPGQVFTVKDYTGKAATHNVTFNFTIDGNSSPSLSSPYDGVRFTYNGTGWTFLP